ncbi:hypothetical protein IMSHALPRED_008293 [Imshaugia aleurites]|uniref:Rhodopsin domain-containing protein n=1 Tax=Imshaugia aleurites TaxID=172621 RepID=A0A8H3FU00_9LECA|nr:hypothetical protein IMSHALPRED_008293 [Imshaugia aleurites]
MAISETPGKTYALAAVLSLLAIVAVILRFYSRRLLKTASIEIDDYMILPALLFTLGTGLCMFIGAALGDLGRHTKIDATAVLLFYRRIFTNGRVVYAIWTMVILVNVWTVAFFCTNLLQCIPISVNWTGWGAAVDSCINTNTMFLAQAWSDVVTDVMILSLPLPCIWRLQMPTSRKIAVCSIFLLGTLVIAVGVAKLVVFYNVVAETQSQNNDVTYILTPTLYWPMVESSLGVVGACLPSMRPIFRDFSLDNLARSIRSIRHLISSSKIRSLVSASSIRSRTSSNSVEKGDEASSSSSTRGLCRKCSESIEVSYKSSASEANVRSMAALYDTTRFDDLPDFPSLGKVESGRRADEMV